MKYKINMSEGESISADEEMVEFINDSSSQMITFRKDSGVISKIINKAHIVSILPDYDSQEGSSERIPEDHQLAEPPQPFTEQQEKDAQFVIDLIAKEANGQQK